MDITPRQQAIAKGQRSLGSFLRLHLSSTFLRILAVPNNAVLCSNLVLMVMPSLSSHVSNLLLTALRAPTTTGTTSCCLTHVPIQSPSSNLGTFQSFHPPCHTLCDPTVKQYYFYYYYYYFYYYYYYYY